MYKILICGLTYNPGGMERVINNFFKNMNKERFHFDFMYSGNQRVAFWEEYDELSKEQVKYYQLPVRRENPWRYDRKIEAIFKKYAKEYDAIWVNALSLENMKYIKYAKKYGIKKRIIHSHNTGVPAKGIGAYIHEFNKRIVQVYATDFWTCSDEATEWMFPKKLHSKVEWIRNAIDVEQFLFDDKKRIELRNELGIKEDEFVIGNVARINKQKNQEFILEIFAEVVKKRENSRLVLVGGGDTSALKKQATTLGILDKILFLGMRDNVAELYNIFDFLIFPSRYEGLPVSLLEVQANGLPMLTSDVITKQVVVNDNYESLSLDNSASIWANKVLELSENNRIDKKTIQKNFKETGFDIQSEVKRVEELF